MGLIFTLRMLGDLSLYLCLATTVARVFGLAHLPMIPLFILAASCGACYALRGLKHPALQLAPLSLMLLCGFFIYGLVDLLVLLPAAGFCAVTCHRQLFHEDKLAYRGRFLLFVKVLVPLILLGLLMGRETVERFTLPFALLTVLTGVYLMQMLRQSEAVLSQGRFRLLNLIILLAAVGLGLALSTPVVMAAARALLGGMYTFIIAPILLAVAYVFVGVAWLLGPLFRWIFSRPVPQEETATEEAVDTYFSDLQADMPEALKGQMLLQVLLALAIVALLVLAVLLLRRMLGRRQTAAPALTETRQQAEARVIPRQPLLRRNPRDQVRAAFRRFLLVCRGQGIQLEPRTTSLDAARQSAGWCPGEIPGALRALYIKARYSEQPITREDAQLAREHVAAIRRIARKNKI